MMKTCRPLAKLSNEQLIRKGDRAVRCRHELAIEILDCLIEIDRRSLHLSEGHSSLFAFCTRHWHYSRPKAGRTVAVARCIQNFPAVRSLLVERKITVCGVSIIASILTEKNSSELLHEISGKKYTEIEKIVASLRTAPKIREFVRPVGREMLTGRQESEGNNTFFDTPKNSAGGKTGLPGCESQFETDHRGDGTAVAGGESQFETDHRGDGTAVAGGESQFETDHRGDGTNSDEAKGAQRYEIRFTASEEFIWKLERARAVCSRRSSMEAILEKGLDELLERHDPERKQARRDKRKSGKQNGARGTLKRRSEKRNQSDAKSATDKKSDQQKRDAEEELFQEIEGEERSEGAREQFAGRGSQNTGGRAGGGESPPERGEIAKRRSRHIPAGLRDAVFTRDGGRCTYVGNNGVQCGATAHLQIDHIKPFCRGGEHTVENLRVLCGRHNRLAARELAASH